MKITDPGIIQTGEKKLIAAVQEHLDLETVKKILMDRMAETSFSSKGGQIVVHDNQIAFQLDFDLKLSGSLLFDRQGNYIPASSKSDDTIPFSAVSEDMDDLDDDDILDDDINDILKESREFWEQKKGS